jgi:hypothetical protein
MSRIHPPHNRALDPPPLPPRLPMLYTEAGDTDDAIRARINRVLDQAERALAKWEREFAIWKRRQQ